MAKFNIGDQVIFVNDYGVVFAGREISGLEIWKDYPDVQRYFMAPTDAPWFSSKEENFVLAPQDFPVEKQVDAVLRVLAMMNLEQSYTNSMAAIVFLNSVGWSCAQPAKEDTKNDGDI